MSKAARSLPFVQTMVFSGKIYNESSDSDDTLDESNHHYEYIMLRAGQYGTESSGANGWEYKAYSECRSRFSVNIPHPVAANDVFSLGCNTYDLLILGRVKLDIEQYLMQVRLEVFESKNGQRIGHAEAIAGAFLIYAFKLFHAWINTEPF